MGELISHGYAQTLRGQPLFAQLVGADGGLWSDPVSIELTPVKVETDLIVWSNLTRIEFAVFDRAFVSHFNLIDQDGVVIVEGCQLTRGWWVDKSSVVRFEPGGIEVRSEF